MNVETVDQGFVVELSPNKTAGVAVGPRAAVTRQGDVVCTYMAQSALGVNDFVPMLARSDDQGITWQEQGPLWPRLTGRQSLFGSISRSPSGILAAYGISTPIDRPDEPFWSEANHGLKQNSLFWAVSRDDGRTWSDPRLIPLPLPGSAEAPGPLCLMRRGRWIGCYAPYNTFDPAVRVDRHQVVCVFSDDEGDTWRHSVMHRFAEEDSGGAEAWVIELADGRLLGTSWHTDHRQQQTYPNAWAVSRDGGCSWSPTRSTGLHGQSTALAALPDGSALFVYNQRKHGEIGIWLAHVRPTDSDFGVLSNQVVWQADTATQHGSEVEHRGWQDFAFGEPSVTLLPDGTLLLVFWCVQPHGRGIAYMKLRTSLLHPPKYFGSQPAVTRFRTVARTPGVFRHDR